MRSINLWYDGTYLSVILPVKLQSQRIIDLINKIGSSDIYREFSRDLMSLINLKNSLLYYITSISSYFSAAIFEYVYSKDHPELEQVNFSLLIEKYRRIPLFFEIYTGSIPDVDMLKSVIPMLSPMIESIAVILDHKFFSLENLRIIKGMKYIITTSLVRKEIKAVFLRASRNFDRSENVIVYEGETIFCQHVSFRIEDLNLQG